ncbi:MAG TPA: RNA nucleotidyltransferase, partial [Thermomicrobiales bacterium]|nr:RNA nucleotidyltransferase [Thermomicrobiales bacterium]
MTARLGERFAAAGETLYLVGGIVRDLLLGRDLPADLDFTTSAAPEVSQRLTNAAGADSIYLVGERFGTVGAVFGGAPDRVLVEITTYRREHYPDATRFPVVRFEASLIDDLSRRDFTINAIAADALTGEIVDPFGGEADIALGVLRAVGNPDERFAEDPLRLLRAARFVAQLGFRLDWETEAAMARHAADLRRISRERIYAELTKLLVGPFADYGLDALRRAGLLAEAIPELAPLSEEAELDLRGRMNREKDLWEHTLRVVDKAPARPIVRWAALLHDAAKPHTRSVSPDGQIHFFGHERVGAGLAETLL